MTSPRSTYGGGYYSASSFPDTPIYDSLVAERGTPQIAPIRVPAAYDTPSSNLPALPSALPALPGGSLASPSAPTAIRRQPAQQPAPLQQAPRRRTSRSRPAAARLPGRPAPAAAPGAPGTGYEAMRPAARRGPRRPRRRTRTRTTASSTGDTDHSERSARTSGTVPPGRMAPWGIRSCSSIHVHPVKAFRGSGTPTRPSWSPGGWPATAAGCWSTTRARSITQRQQPRLALAAAELLPGGGLALSAPGPAPLTVPVPEPVGTVDGGDLRDKVEAVAAPTARGARLVQRLPRAPTCGSCTWTTRRTRRPVDPEYARPGETVSFADGYPLLLTTTASLDALNALIAQGDHARRGPAADGPLPAERGRRRHRGLGRGRLAADRDRRGHLPGRQDVRAVRVTTTDQGTAERGKEPLRTLARHRRFGDQLVFGQNLVPNPARHGPVGDPVRRWHPRRRSVGLESTRPADPGNPRPGSGALGLREKFMRGPVRG